MSRPDEQRLSDTFERLDALGFRDFAITGGVATALRLGLKQTRPLADLDLVVSGVQAVPVALAGPFLVRHYHPHVRQGRILLQLVDPIAKLRIDIFTPYGNALRRAGIHRGLSLLSAQDIAARLGAVLMELHRGKPVERKHLASFNLLLDLVNMSDMSAAWEDNRKPSDPGAFAEAAALIAAAAKAAPDLLIESRYSADVNVSCPDCAPSGAFRCASPEQILPILGYV